jgi:hypothetical protein
VCMVFKTLTWDFDSLLCEIIEVACCSGLPQLLPVGVERVAGVRCRRVRQEALLAWLDGVARPVPLPARVCQGVPHRRLVQLLALSGGQHAPYRPVVRRVVLGRRQRRVGRQRAPSGEVNLVYCRAIGKVHPPVPLRARPWLEVLVVEREHEHWHLGAGPHRRAGVLGHPHHEVPVVDGGVVDVAANLVEVAAVGPAGLCDGQLDVRVSELRHGDDHGVEHFVQQVGVLESRGRVDVAGAALEKRVVERHGEVVPGPDEVGVRVDEVVGVGPVEEVQQRAHDGLGDVGAERGGGRRARERAVDQRVHGERGADFDAADAVLAEAPVEVVHRRHKARPRGGRDGVVREHLVSHEQELDPRLRVVGDQVLRNPPVRGGGRGGDVRDDLVGHHDGDRHVRPRQRAQHGRVRVVDLDRPRAHRADQLHRPPRRWDVVRHAAVVDADAVAAHPVRHCKRNKASKAPPFLSAHRLTIASEFQTEKRCGAYGCRRTQRRGGRGSKPGAVGRRPWTLPWLLSSALLEPGVLGARSDLGSGDGWQRWLLFGETGRGWGEFFKLKFGNGIFSLFFFINNFLYLFILFKIFYLNI